LSIDRQDIVKHKFHRFCQIAGSLLSPLLDESVQVSFAYNPVLAEQLLDQSGYPRQNNGGIRFSLTYKTTPVREGYETALMFKEMLKKVGINLVLTVVEPAVFLASVKKGNFQLFSSRWVGVADGSILFNTLHSKQKNNRVFYNDLAMDQWLEQAMQEVSLEKRKELLKLVQIKMGKDLPYFPLWYWNNALLIKKEKGKNFKSEYLSIKGALEPLTEIQDSQP
ncbi:MAG: hypothetical protein HY072_09875, partial [Deltaproteobacteria bacterium]|nr:hypothetical protein [Deltaproteobacteria bacterium]